MAATHAGIGGALQSQVTNRMAASGARLGDAQLDVQNTQNSDVSCLGFLFEPLRDF